MKKLSLLLLGLTTTFTCYAQYDQGTFRDTVGVQSIEDIIAEQTNAQSDYKTKTHYQSVWSKNSFLNIAYNSTTLSSKEFPTVGGAYEDDFDNKFGIGIQIGKTYNFHKNPIGDVLFVGADVTPLDFSYNSYEKTDPSLKYNIGTTSPYNVPWHQKKWSIDYGVSVGPSLTFYPFTAIGNNITDKIRLQLYFHLGYSVGIVSISDISKSENSKDTETAGEFGHGLFTSFGFNLSWDFIGIGYESYQASNYKYNAIDDKYKTGSFKAKRSIGRVYLHIRL